MFISVLVPYSDSVQCWIVRLGEIEARQSQNISTLVPNLSFTSEGITLLTHYWDVTHNITEGRCVMRTPGVQFTSANSTPGGADLFTTGLGAVVTRQTGLCEDTLDPRLVREDWRAMT